MGALSFRKQMQALIFKHGTEISFVDRLNENKLKKIHVAVQDEIYDCST